MFCLAACRKAPSPALDSDLSSCIPPGATLVAGVDLAQLRSSPLYANLPSATRHSLEPFREASYAIVASDGSRFVVAARGRLDGAKMLTSNLGLIGSQDFVDAAAAQHRTGRSGVPSLVAHAPGSPLWIVADGSGTIPLTGNARNLNRLLHDTEYLTIAVTFAARPAIVATGVCRGEDAARRIEESARALVSIGRVATPIQIRRDGVTVVIETEVEPDDLAALLR
jgi:hypothetical protein